MIDRITRLFLQYLKSCSVSEKTYRNYKSDLALFAAWLIFKTKSIGADCQNLQEALPFITKSTANEYKEFLLANNTPAPTLNRRLSTLRTFSKFLLENQLLTFDFAQGVKNISKASNLTPFQKDINEFTSFLESEKVSPLTIKNYLSDISQFLRWIEKTGKKEVNQIISKDIKRYLVVDLAYAPQSTKDRKVASLKKFFNWAVQEKKIDFNPVEKYLEETAYIRPIQESLSEISNKDILRNVSGVSPSYQPWRERITAYLADKPRLQKLVYNLLYTRPKWYITYHSLAFTRYLHLAILIVFAAALGFGAYQQLFSKTQTPIAYPTQPTPPKRYLSFQGRLTNQYNTPITTATSVVFKLYDAATAGNVLWNSAGVSCSITPDQDGIFSILLGTESGDGYTCTGISAIDASVFSENPEVWLGVKVGTDAEATPRIQIATVAYALNAETLQGYPINATGSATKNTVLTMNSGGEVILAEVGPKIKSVSGNFSVQGEAITLQANGGSVAGDITLSPASSGTVSVLASGTTNDSLYIQNAQITSGALIHGYYSGAATDVDLLKLGAGATEATKFLVESSGDTFLASGADLYIGGIGLNDNASSSSGASLIGLYDDAMTYISSNTNVQSAIKQLDTAIGTVSGSAGGWTDDGTIVRLTTATDQVGIGTTSPTGKFEVNNTGLAALGKALAIFNQAENQDILTASASGTPRLTVTNAGNLQFHQASSITTTTGALTLQPAAGSNLNVSLSTTGDFAVNTNQLYVDTSAGNVGIGTTAPAARLHITGTSGTGTLTVQDAIRVGDNSTPNTDFLLAFEKNRSDTSGTYQGVRAIFTPSATSNSTADFTAGSFVNNPQPPTGVTYSGSITSVYGGGTVAGAGTVTNFWGLKGAPDAQGTSTITNAYAIEGVLTTNSTGATITNAYRAKLSKSTSIGTIVNNYGLYIDAMDQGTNLNYAIYSAGGQSYFAGNVGIGTAGPDRKLDVLDSTNPQLRLTQTDGTVYTDFQVDASGNLIVTTTGTTVTFSGDNVSVGGNLTVSGGNITLNTAGTIIPSAAGTITVGNANLQSLTITTDGTGNGEVVLPNDSIGPNEVLSTGQTDEYCLTYEATGSTWEWQSCGSGGSSAWSALTNPTANLTLAHAQYSTVMNWDMGTDATFDAWTSTITNDLATDTTIQRLMVLRNADDGATTTGTTERLLVLDNADTNEAVTTALEILASSTGSITTAIDVSDAEIGTALSIGANDVSATNWSITGATGNITTTGDLAINGGDITSTSSTLTINAGGNVDIQDALNADSITTDTGGISIAAGQSYTGSGAVTLSSGGGLGLTIDSASGTITFATDDDLIPTLGAADADIGSSGARWDNIFAVAGNFSGTITASDFSCTDCLDFSEFEDTLDLDAALILNQSTNTWTQNFDGTTTIGLTYNANSLTSGTGLYLSSTSTGLTGDLLKIEASGNNAGVTGNALKVGLTGASATGTALNVTTAGSSGYALRVNDDGTYTDSTPFVIDTSGNVGIGTTSPAGLLHIYSSADSNHRVIIDAQGVSTLQQATLELVTLGDGTKTLGNATTKGWQIIGRGNAYTTSAQQNDLGFSYWDGTTWTNSMWLDSASGNVGIGTTSPQQKLTLSSGSNYATEMVTPGTPTVSATTGGTLAAGTYYIKIVASDGVGTTTGSSEASCTVDGTTTNACSISWSAVTGASSYRVYVGSSSGGQDRYWSTSATSYTLTAFGTGDGSTAGTVPTVTTAYVNKLTASGNSWMLGGNVGIGTAAPISKLQVAGGTIVLDRGQAVQFLDSVGTARNSLFYTTGNILQLTNNDNGVGGPITFNTKAGAGESVRIDSAGNVGIGTTNPSSFKLQVAGHVGPNADNSYNLGSSSLRWGNIYGVNIYGNITPTGFTQGSVIFAGSGGTLSQNNTQFFWDNTNYRLGIGTTTPRAAIDLGTSGAIIASDFYDTTGYPTYYINPAGSSNLGGDITLGGNINLTGASPTISSNNGGVYSTIIITGSNSSSTSLCVEDAGTPLVDCDGKIDAGTIDPPYTINNKRYATYVASMTGVKEETTGKVITEEYIPGFGYRKIINFSEQEEGSDLWLFSKVSNLRENMDKMSILLTPAKNTKTWYRVNKDSFSLEIYSSQKTEISYRLTAPRFDYQKWSNRRSDNDPSGFIIDDPDIRISINRQEIIPNFLIKGDDQALVFSGDITKFKNDNQSFRLESEYKEESIATNQLFAAQGYLGYINTKNILVDANTLSENIFVKNKLESKAIKTVIAEILDTLQSKIIKAKEITTDKLYALQAQVDNLLIKTGLVSPIIKTANITPLDGQTDINIKLGGGTGSDPVQGKLSVQDQNGQEVAAFDTAGNATFSGELTANKLNTEEVTAQKIYADQIVAKDGTILDISTANLSGVTMEQIEELLREAEADQKLLQMASDWNIETASQSAKLANIETANIQNLFVTNSAAFNSLSVSNSLALGTDFVISANSDGLATTLNSLSAPLSIQSLALAPVEIMAGKLRIETNGDVYIQGNLYVAGNITSQGIKIATGGTGSDPVQTTAAITASGSAEFKEVVSDKFIIAGASVATDSAQITDGKISTNATTGSAILPAGMKEVEILSPAITQDTLIYITPTSDTKNYVLYVKAKEEGRAVVGFNRALDIDVTFNWWVIKVKN